MIFPLFSALAQDNGSNSVQESSTNTALELENKKADPDGIPTERNRLYRILDYYDTGALRLSGRLYYDFAALNQSSGDNRLVEYGTLARSFRLRADGRISSRLNWRAELEIVSNTFTFRGAYLYYRKANSHLMFGNIIKEPMGLERMSPLGWYPFVELPPASGAFMPARNLTLRFEQRGFFYNLMASLHNGADSITDSSLKSGYAVTGRATIAPINTPTEFLHFGLNGSYRASAYSTPDSLNGQRVFRALRFPINPGSRAVGSAFFGSKNISDANYHTRFIVETATGMNAWYIQAEYTGVHVNRIAPEKSIYLYGYYVQTGFFLTGETRPYRATHGSFGPLTPLSDFDSGRGTGAIELALRYSLNNYDDINYLGGMLRHYGAAFNWYISRDTRVMFNVFHYSTSRFPNQNVKGMVFASRINFEF
mgnify:FL=1